MTVNEKFNISSVKRITITSKRLKYIDNGELKLEDSILNLYIKDVTSKVSIKNKIFNEILLYKCQNILIENCKVGLLQVEMCSNIIIENSDCINLRFLLSRDSEVNGCNISEESLERSKNKYLDIMFNRAIFLLILGSISLYFIIYLFFFLDNIYGIILFTSILVSTYIYAVYSRRKIYLTKYLPDNRFNNNKYLDNIQNLKREIYFYFKK